jgi:hypothetical protein
MSAFRLMVLRRACASVLLTSMIVGCSSSSEPSPGAAPPPVNAPPPLGEPATISTLFAAWGVEIFGDLVKDQVREHVTDPVTGWVLSVLGLEDTTPTVDDRVDALAAKLEAFGQRLQWAGWELDAMFADAKCHVSKLDLGVPVSTLNQALDDYLDITVDGVSTATRVAWAERLLRKDDVGAAVQHIRDAMLGSGGGPSAIDTCSRLALLQWSPHSDKPALYAHERNYFEPTQKLFEYYMNAQVLGAYLMITASNLLATQFAVDEGIELESESLARRVCGDIDFDAAPVGADKFVPQGRRDACALTRRTLEEIAIGLRRQLTKVGAGYSQSVTPKNASLPKLDWTYELKPNVEFISAVRGVPSASPQVWVLDPRNFEMPAGTAAEATRVSGSFAGLQVWRGAGTDDWKPLLDSLEQWGEFVRPGVDGFVSRVLLNAVGLDGFADRPADGRRAVIWMASETSPFWPGSPDLAFCMLIPYSQRGVAATGLGTPLCSQDELFRGLFTRDPSVPWWETHRYLTDSVQGHTPAFWFGQRRGPPPAPGPLVAKYLDGSFRLNPPYTKTDVPAWVHRSFITRHEHMDPGPEMEPYRVDAQARSAQVIFPVADVDESLCLVDQIVGGSPMEPVTSDGVPTMCAVNMETFLDAVITWGRQ